MLSTPCVGMFLHVLREWFSHNICRRWVIIKFSNVFVFWHGASICFCCLQLFEFVFQTASQHFLQCVHILSTFYAWIYIYNFQCFFKFYGTTQNQPVMLNWHYRSTYICKYIYIYIYTCVYTYRKSCSRAPSFCTCTDVIIQVMFPIEEAETRSKKHYIRAVYHTGAPCMYILAESCCWEDPQSRGHLKIQSEPATQENHPVAVAPIGCKKKQDCVMTRQRVVPAIVHCAVKQSESKLQR